MNDVLAELLGLVLDGAIDAGMSPAPVARNARLPRPNDRYAAKGHLQLSGTATAANGSYGRIAVTLLDGDVVVVRAVAPSRSMAIVTVQDHETDRGSNASSSQHALMARFEQLELHFQLLAPEQPG